MNKLYRLIFGSRYPKQLDPKPFLPVLYSFATNGGEDFNGYFPITTITYIKAVETDSAIELTIVTPRPGIIIGKGGSTIDALESWLNQQRTNSKRIAVRIEEDKYWHYAYKFNNQYPFNKK